ncbi:retrovirus-related pol polyprotein from transposon TNT 1-94 [Tanacetum coccineum]
MHNDIMGAGSRERPPMLASGIAYKDQLRHCIEKGPYILTEIVHEKVQATEEQPGHPRRVEQETYVNTTPENRKLIDAEAEAKAIHMILNEIGDEIYSTVDAYSTAREIDEESIKSYYSRFYKMMTEMIRNKLKVDTMQIARNAKPLALVVAAQHYLDKYYLDTYYQAPKPHKTHTSSSKHPSSSSHATTKNKSEEMAKLHSLQSTSKTSTNLPTTTSKLHQTPGTRQWILLQDLGMTNNLTVAGARETIGNQVVQHTGIQCFNCKEYGHFAKECRKPKWPKDYAYHKEKMMLCKQEEKANIQKVPTADSETTYDVELLEKKERVKNELQNPITRDVKLHVKDMLMPLAQDTKSNALLFETHLKTEIFSYLKYVQSLEKEVDELQTDKTELLKEHDLLLQECVSKENKVQFKATHCKVERKSVDTKFEKSSVVRQPNAFKFQKPSVLGKPTPFSDSLEKKDFSKPKSVTRTNVNKDFSKQVTPQILPQSRNQAVRNMNVIKPGMYRIDTRTTQTRAPQLHQTFRKTDPHVYTSTRVIHKTSVSRPQLRITQMNEKVMQNNSQVKPKKTNVEDHHRISSFSNNKTKSVTACNDNLKSRTSNVNAVCVTFGNCVFNSNHDSCVSKFINDVNARKEA